MDINSFVDNVAAQFDDLNETLVPDTIFREIDSWSSLTALSIISMIDEEYDVQLTGADIRSSQTIKDVFDKVVAKKG